LELRLVLLLRHLGPPGARLRVPAVAPLLEQVLAVERRALGPEAHAVPAGVLLQERHRGPAAAVGPAGEDLEPGAAVDQRPVALEEEAVLVGGELHARAPEAELAPAHVGDGAGPVELREAGEAPLHERPV